jgi:C-terminal processing protease CtpA/Prc
VVSLLAAALSVLLHASVLTLALLKSPPPVPPPKPPPSSVRLSMPDDDLKFARHGGIGSITCSKTYKGIGVRSNFLGQVIEVAIGGPAWKGGIRAGDTLYGLGLLSPDSHPLGAIVEVERVHLDDSVEPIRLKIEKICQI